MSRLNNLYRTHTAPLTRVIFSGMLLMSPMAAQYLRGVNLSGAEFGDGQIPGKFNRDYTYSSATSFRYFAAKNLGLIRLPVRWERLQPSPSGPLDANTC